MYSPSSGIIFHGWYKRIEDTFTVQLAAHEDATKVKLVLRKLAPPLSMYGNVILSISINCMRAISQILWTRLLKLSDNLVLFSTPVSSVCKL